MSLRIGILTTYFSKNYGAALQAYATVEKLRRMGYDSEIIGYQKAIKAFYTPAAVVESERHMPFVLRLKRKIKNAFIKVKKSDPALTAGAAIRDQEFDRFVADFLHVSKAAYASPEEFLKAVPDMPYDVFLCGSDQIWNPIVHNFDDVYYLNFPTKAKKIAYAPSIAYNRFSDSEIERICKAIRSIDCISVREKSTVEWLQPHMEKKVNYVIDPTFLLDKNTWLELKSDKTFDGKYILVYLLNYNEQNKNIVGLICRLAREQGCRIVCLPYTPIRFPKDIQAEYRYDIAPNDFIHLLAGAEYVVTNSFHATALSVNFNIPFYVVSSRERNKDLQARLSDLLEETGLEDRKIYADTASIDGGQTIDYDAANAILAERRRQGAVYLRQSLENGGKA